MLGGRRLQRSVSLSLFFVMMMVMMMMMKVMLLLLLKQVASLHLKRSSKHSIRALRMPFCKPVRLTSLNGLKIVALKDENPCTLHVSPTVSI